MLQSRILPLLPLVLVATAVTAAPAAADDAAAPATVAADWERQTIVYTAAPGQVNELQVNAMGTGADVRRVAFNDEVPIAAGDHCTQPDPRDDTRVVCELPLDASRPDDIRVRLGDGDDEVFTDDPGVTLVDGGTGDDELHAHSAHTVLGGPGDDMVMGRAVMHGGDGADHLMGMAGYDQTFFGGRGDDHIEAFAGNDVVHAGAGNDHVTGGEGNDVLLGGVGDDTLHGDEGDDVLIGGPGDDTLHGGPGRNVVIK